jgi:hypothetical protein
MLCYRSNDKFDLKEQFAPTHMMWWWSNGKFDPKNSWYLPFCPYLQPNSQFDPKNSLCLPICLYLQSSVKFDPKNSLYLPICLCFRSSAKFDPKNSLHLSLALYSLVKWLVRSKEQLVPYFLSPGLSTLSMSTWIPSDMTCSMDSSCLSCIHNQNVAWHSYFENLRSVFLCPKTVQMLIFKYLRPVKSKTSSLDSPDKET